MLTKMYRQSNKSSPHVLSDSFIAEILQQTYLASKCQEFVARKVKFVESTIVLSTSKPQTLSNPILHPYHIINDAKEFRRKRL